MTGYGGGGYGSGGYGSGGEGGAAAGIPPDFYIEWPYVLTYTITNPPASIAAAPTPVTVTWWPGMRTDFRDLRFGDVDAVPCSFRLESYTEGVSATFLVGLWPGQSELFVLYGNGAAQSASDPTFCPVVDGFDDASLDGTLWTDLGGNTEAAGLLTVEGAVAGVMGVRSKATYAKGNAVRARLTWPDAAGPVFGFTNATRTEYVRINRVAPDLSRLEVNDGTGERVKYLGTLSGDHTIEVRRPVSGAVRVYIDGVLKATETAVTVPAGALPFTIAVYDADQDLAADWVTVRPVLDAEPVLAYAGADLNPWYPLSTPNPALFDSPASTAFADQRIIGWTVRRSIADAMYRAEVEFDGLLPADTAYNWVELAEYVGSPSAAEVAAHPDLYQKHTVFYGFLGQQDITLDLAKNRTNMIGYDYGYFIAGRRVGLSSMVVTAATNPGTGLLNQFVYGNWWDPRDFPGDGGAGTTLLFDTSNINVISYTATHPAMEHSAGDKATWMQFAQQIADDAACIWYPHWLDVGTTQTYGHQDPAYRIIQVRAVDYDTGGQNVGYYDTTPGNTGGAGLRNDDVDIEPNSTSVGFNVGWIRNTEWLKYTVAIPEVPGTWTAKFLIASPLGGQTVTAWWGTDPASLANAGSITVDQTGSYESFSWDNQTVNLTVAAAGTHYLKLVFSDIGAGDNDHMNIAAIDLCPPPAPAPDAAALKPALYFVAEGDIDVAAPGAGLDLPPLQIIQPWDPSLVGAVKYTEDSADIANHIVVRYSLAAAPDTLLEYSCYTAGWSHGADGGVYDPNGMAHVLEHLEVLKTPVSSAAVITNALGDSPPGFAAVLADYYSRARGSVSATFIGRPDLQLFQKLRFVGCDGVPDDVDFRIASITYTKKLASFVVQVTATPATTFSIERRLARLRAGDEATEIEAMVRHVTDGERKPVTGAYSADQSGVPSGSIRVTKDGGGDIICRGVGSAITDRYVCIYSEGIGWVASRIN